MKHRQHAAYRRKCFGGNACGWLLQVDEVRCPLKPLDIRKTVPPPTTLLSLHLGGWCWWRSELVRVRVRGLRDHNSANQGRINTHPRRNRNRKSKPAATAHKPLHTDSVDFGDSHVPDRRQRVLEQLRALAAQQVIRLAEEGTTAEEVYRWLREGATCVYCPGGGHSHLASIYAKLRVRLEREEAKERISRVLGRTHIHIHTT